MAIMAALAGLKNARPNQIIKKVLQAGLDMENNAIWQELVSYDITSAFWNMVSQGTGYKDADADLRHLAVHLLLTAATRTMRQDAFSGLELLFLHRIRPIALTLFPTGFIVQIPRTSIQSLSMWNPS